MKPDLKVGICIPSGHLWEADFGMCLINLFTHLLTRPMKNAGRIHFALYNKRTSLLPKSRQSLLEDAIAAACNWALFIDTDQTFPSNLLYRLLHWDKSVVACNIATKSVPAQPTARNFNPKWPGGDPVYSDPDKHGLEQVWRIGTGVMLINLNILRTIPKPWFGVEWRENQNEFVGEDWLFCEKLEAAGNKIYIDHDLSREVGHIGKLTYHHGMVGEVVQVPTDEEPQDATEERSTTQVDAREKARDGQEVGERNPQEETARAREAQKIKPEFLF